MNGTTTEESGWTKANLQKLLAVMKNSIPEHNRMSVYTKGLKTIDWNEVAFPPFSPEECQEKWSDILQKMRKIRTLTELIVEAEDTISNPLQNIKIHPELPKRPRPPNAIFCEENWAKYHKKHPEMSKPKLFRHINKKYRTLSDEKKGKYVEKFELAKEEYYKRMQEFSKEYKTTPYRDRAKRKRLSEYAPDGKQRTKYAEGLPPKPPINGRNLFYKEKSAGTTSHSGENDEAARSQNWQDLTEEQRDEYSARCRELNRRYSIKLHEYLKTFDAEEQQQILNEIGIKSRKEKKKYPGEPKMPCRSGNVIFCQNQMKLLKDEFPIRKERFTKVNQMWLKLSSQEKERYRAEVEENIRKYSIRLQNWFKKLSAEEQEVYRTCNLRKLKYLNVNQIKVHKREDQPAAVHRPSDSEDEDIEDSSSDDEDNSECNEVEEEEDEDDYDITFEVC